MKQLYLCEKPSQAKDIARVLGANQRHNGYFKGNDVIVTWCIGHLLEMAAPDDYDPDLKSWRLETLPIIPKEWILKVRKDAKKQYKIIVSLFKQADEIVVSTDADREGETIAREVMDRGGWKGPITRLWLSALDDKSIRHALDNRLPGEQTEALYQAASARSKADWLVGMTLSRLYTLSARQSGHEAVMSVGRVQTPTLKLVVDRDRIIENFKRVAYFDVMADFQKMDQVEVFAGKWKVPDAIADEEGRCLNQSSAQAVATRCHGKDATVIAITTKRIKEAPPLLYALSTLQQEASKRFGMGAQAVLDCAQALYETHKVTSYPRTDCQYLPESQQGDAESIIKTLQNIDEYQAIAGQADASYRSKVWNDKKITAHHAIIPTGGKLTTQLTESEKKLYDLICRRYLAQFYPAYEVDQTHIEMIVGEDGFLATGKRMVVSGWKVVEQNPAERSSAKELPNIDKGDTLKVVNTKVEHKQTQPPARHTEGTLIQAMKNIGKWVENPALKKRLKETSGIGTEATRASIIEVLLKRKFITKQGKKHLVSTVQARALIDALPEPVKDPATTAVWEQALDDIAQGKGNAMQFVQDQAAMVIRLTERVKQGVPSAFKVLETNTEKFSCSECDHFLVRRKGKNGFFWGCQNYPECKVTLPDDKGRPGKAKAKAEPTDKPCPECEGGMMLMRTVKKGKKRGKTFLGCNRYPACSHTEG
jgi:DNA topoisomerase III